MMSASWDESRGKEMEGIKMSGTELESTYVGSEDYIKMNQNVRLEVNVHFHVILLSNERAKTNVAEK